ncbi:MULTISPECIES: universal stress protein [Salinibaculum]|uniref:universal stress protein n=1 Tax=Salinibaculum TaxID=2732368 RepID=UPI0030CF2066
MSEDWPVLVPVKVLEGQTVSEGVVDLLSTLPVVVLGYHVLPEQTAPGQARLQFEEQAQAKLDDLAAAFRDAGGAAESRLVFTHDAEQTLDRIADETGCRAILIPNPTPPVQRLLVPVRGEVNVPRLAAFVAAMRGRRDIDLTLFHVAETEDASDDGETLVDDASAALRERGVPPTAISRDIVVSETPVRAIATAAAEDHDAVVMGESEPSIRTFLFGDPSEQVATQSVGPVIVVRRPRDESEESETGENAVE